jgi:hypothetical protein
MPSTIEKQKQNQLAAMVKASFNLPREELEGLRELAKKRRVSVTQALRQAIATERFLADQPEGSKVFIEDPDGKMREVVFRG